GCAGVPRELVRRRRPVWMCADVGIPGSVRAEVVLARTRQVAVAIGSVRACPNGLEFALHTRLRGEDETGLGRGDPLERHGWRRGSRAPDEGLRLGVGYADGRRAAAPSGHPRPGDDRGRLVVLPKRGRWQRAELGWEFVGSPAGAR